MSARDPIKVYDARWEVSEFDDAAVTRLFEAALAYGRLIGVDTVTLTRDAREGCARVLEIGIGVARRMGMRTFARLEPVSTPQGYFTALHVGQKFPKVMGLGITASHNPRQYVGIKFTVPPVAAIGYDCGPLGGLTKVRELYHAATKYADAAVPGELEILDLTREYVDFSLAAAGVEAGSLAGLTVVLDAFHGAAGPEIVLALRKAGVRVETLRLVPNGEFPTGSPNPTSQGKMADAVALAKRIGAQAVLGVDGDGDRVVFGSGRGILTAGFAFVPILQACLASLSPQSSVLSPSAPAALYDPKVSPLALAEWGKLGARPVLFRNGHSQIKDYMTQIGALAAAEESGHYYHRISLGKTTIAAENSIVTILLFLAALKKDPGVMEQLWTEESSIFTTGEFNYAFASDALRDQALAAVIAACVKDGCATVTATPDGIDLEGTCLSKGVTLEPGHVKLEAGWYAGYLRASTNEKGVARSYFSAADARTGKRVETEARRILAEEFRGKVIE